MKKIKLQNFKLLFPTFIFVFSSAFLFKVNAAEINFVSPDEDLKLYSTQDQNLQITWQIEQTQNTQFPYEMFLKDSVCSNTLGEIDSKQLQPGTYSKNLNISDFGLGTYCINICVNDLDEIECNNRLFKMVEYEEIVSVSDEGSLKGENKAPVITSNPQKLKLNYKENFFYTIEANDPNGDIFTYRLISAPDFIYLDQVKGTITNTDLMRPGSYFVAFVAVDRKGASTQQSFTINVFENYDSDGNPIAPDTTPTPSPDEVGKLEIVSPDRGQLLAGTNNAITWNVAGYDFDGLEIYYQIVGGDWTLIRNIESKTVAEVEWDVTGLTNGEYKLKIVLKKGDDVIAEQERESLIVGNNVNSDSLLILNLKPNNQSEITDINPEISLNVLPSGESKVDFDNTKIWLDNRNITSSCSLNNNEIRCNPSRDLSIKEHTVRIRISDTNGQSLEQKWSFTVVEGEPEPTPTPTNGSEITPIPTQGANVFSNLISEVRDRASQIEMNTWILCCGSFLLLAAGLITFRTLRRRPSQGGYSDENTDITSTSEPEDLGASMTPELSNDESTSQSTQEELEDFTDYSVGDYSVGEDYEPIMPSSNIEQDTDSTPPSTSSSDLQTPDFGSNGEDILPDWLKGGADEASKPVDNQGKQIESSNTANITSGAKLHDDFGLSTEEESEDSKKNS